MLFIKRFINSLYIILYTDMIKHTFINCLVCIALLIGVIETVHCLTYLCGALMCVCVCACVCVCVHMHVCVCMCACPCVVPFCVHEYMCDACVCVWCVCACVCVVTACFLVWCAGHYRV